MFLLVLASAWRAPGERLASVSRSPGERLAKSAACCLVPGALRLAHTCRPVRACACMRSNVLFFVRNPLGATLHKPAVSLSCGSQADARAWPRAKIVSCCRQAESQTRIRTTATHLHSLSAWRCPQCGVLTRTTGMSRPIPNLRPILDSRETPCTPTALTSSTTCFGKVTTALSICDGKWGRDACRNALAQTTLPNHCLGCPRD